jgi:hypothetical protein
VEWTPSQSRHAILRRAAVLTTPLVCEPPQPWQWPLSRADYNRRGGRKKSLGDRSGANSSRLVLRRMLVSQQLVLPQGGRFGRSVFPSSFGRALLLFYCPPAVSFSLLRPAIERRLRGLVASSPSGKELPTGHRNGVEVGRKTRFSLFLLPPLPHARPVPERLRLLCNCPVCWHGTVAGGATNRRSREPYPRWVHPPAHTQ